METVELYDPWGLFSYLSLVDFVYKTLRNIQVYMQKKLLGHTADVPAIPEFSFSTVVIAPITINTDCYKPDITSIVKLFITEFFFWLLGILPP